MLALELAKEKDADIVLATDPDADRLGVYAKDEKTGEHLDEPVPVMDDAMAALRYGVEGWRKAKRWLV